MSINAPWGTGKTFFIKRWLQLFDTEEKQIVLGL